MTKARDLGDFISDGTIAETVTADGLNLGDNEKIQLGASQDLQLYHDGTNSFVQDAAAGAYSAGTIIAELQGAVAVIPTTTLGKEDLHIYMN